VTVVFILWGFTTFAFSFAFFYAGQKELAHRLRKMDGADKVMDELRKMEDEIKEPGNF